MDDALIERVEALERAVTDGEHDLSALATEAEALDRLDRLDDQQAELESRVAELEAATEALRGYVGNIRAVNEDVENKADTALAKAQSLEATASPTSNSSGNRKPDQPRQNQNGRHSREEPPHQQATKQSPSHAQSAEGCPRAGDRNPPNSMTADGGLQRGENHTNSDPSKNGGGIKTQQTHCEACGQSRPIKSPSVEKHREESTVGSSPSDTGRLDEDDLDGLHQEDPLVSEENNTSALSRFKQLL